MDTENSSVIPSMESELFSIILETSLMQLNITAAASRTLDWRNVDPENYEKCQRDRELIMKILCQVLNELNETRTFVTLTQSIEDLSAEENYHEKLMVEHDFFKRSLDAAKAELKHLQDSHRRENKNANTAIEQLKQAIEKSNMNNEIQALFLDKLLASAMEQCSIKLAKNEENDQHHKNHQKSMYFEHKAHESVMKYNEEVMQDHSAAIEYWKSKRRTDKKDYNKRIQDLSKEYSDVQSRRHHLQTVLNAHTDEMNSWLEYKKARDIQRHELAIKLKSAVHIQAWWRMVMVKKGLGAFRKKPNKKKQQDKKNGKDKKKNGDPKNKNSKEDIRNKKKIDNKVNKK